MKVTTGEWLADEINTAMLESPLMPKPLPLKTQMEMARGALGRAVNKEEAEAYVRELGILADGERQLRKLITKDYRLFVMRDTGPGKRIRVQVGKPENGCKVVEFKELFDLFPSNELIAKIMLVAG